MTVREKIMNRLLEACWRRHGKKLPIEYQPYILGMMSEYGGKQFGLGFLLAFMCVALGFLFYALIN